MGGLSSRWIQGNPFAQDLWMATSPSFRKETLSESNYRLFIGFVLDVLLRPWENLVKGLKYTEVCQPINNCLYVS